MRLAAHYPANGPSPEPELRPIRKEFRYTMTAADELLIIPDSVCGHVSCASPTSAM